MLIVNTYEENINRIKRLDRGVGEVQFGIIMILNQY